MSIETTPFFQTLQVDNERRAAAQRAQGSNELGKDEFMRLLVTQLEHQNPLEPTDNTEFIAQLAQFSSLEGITNLNKTVEQFAISLQSTQALQASTLVGREVQVLSNFTELKPNGVVKGTIELPESSADVFVAVYTGAGEYIGDISLGARAAGDLAFEWDGLDTEGEPFPAGMYQFRAFAAMQGENQMVDLYLGRSVSSVALHAGHRGEILLNISGMDQPVTLRDVKVVN